MLDPTKLNSCILHKVLAGEKHISSWISVAPYEIILNKSLHLKDWGTCLDNASSQLHLTERHFPACIPPTKKKTNTKAVYWMAKRKQWKTIRYSYNCKPALCIIPCIYHNKKKEWFWGPWNQCKKLWCGIKMFLHLLGYL